MIGFNVRADAAARKLSEAEGVQIRYYDIIYEAVDDVKNALSGMLAPEQKESNLGLVEIRQVFRISKGWCGRWLLRARRHRQARFAGPPAARQRGGLERRARFAQALRDDVKEVKEGYECGLSLKNYNEIQEGDRLEIYEIVEVADAVTGMKQGFSPRALRISEQVPRELRPDAALEVKDPG